MSSSRRNGSGSGGNSDSRPPILIPTIYSESEMRQIPCGTTRTGLTLPTPYDCRYRNDEYLDRHREYARCGKNVNATNDSSRLTSVAGQDPESIGYYDRYDRLIQHEHVSSTSSECWLIVVTRSTPPEKKISRIIPLRYVLQVFLFLRSQNHTITNEDRRCLNESTDYGNE